MLLVLFDSILSFILFLIKVIWLDLKIKETCLSLCRRKVYWCGWKPILCRSRSLTKALWSRSRCLERWSDSLYFVKWGASILGWWELLTCYYFFDIWSCSCAFFPHRKDLIVNIRSYQFLLFSLSDSTRNGARNIWTGLAWWARLFIRSLA